MEMIHIANREIDGAVEQTVNARELHNSLGVKKDFSDWIKPKLDNGFLKEGRDFIALPLKGDGGKFAKIEYILTLDTAKHIAMSSQTQKAYEVREYFIEMEKRYKIQMQMPLEVQETDYREIKDYLHRSLSEHREEIILSFEQRIKPVNKNKIKGAYMGERTKLKKQIQKAKEERVALREEIKELQKDIRYERRERDKVQSKYNKFIELAI